MLLITITVIFKKLGRPASLISIVLILLGFLTAQFFIVGFTGSRAATMWALFWAAGIIHFFWRPISVKLVIVSIIPLILFAYLYGFYKELGARAFDIFKGQASIESLAYESKRTFARVLVGDFGRSNVQAGLLSVVTNPQREYDFRYGQTYLTSAVSLIPRRLWPTKPEDNGKVIAGTDLLYGKDTYVGRHVLGSIGKRATQIYGLAGEAMLNFGVWGILPAFAAWGYAVGFIRRRLLNYSAGDMRLLAAPFWMLVCFLLLIQDLDNIVEVVTFNLLVPAIIIWVISFKIYLRADENNNEPYSA
jgi:hypothetical protein